MLCGRYRGRFRRLGHGRLFLGVGGGLRGGPRLRLKLNLDVRLLGLHLLRLALRSRLGGLCNLVVDNKEWGER